MDHNREAATSKKTIELAPRELVTVVVFGGIEDENKKLFLHGVRMGTRLIVIGDDAPFLDHYVQTGLASRELERWPSGTELPSGESVLVLDGRQKKDHH